MVDVGRLIEFPRFLFLLVSGAMAAGSLQACSALNPPSGPSETSVPSAATATSSLLLPSPVPTEEMCVRIDSPWVSAEPSGGEGWCKLQGVQEAGSTYDYSLVYPGKWTVTLFGNLSPNLRLVDEATGRGMDVFSFYLQVSEERKPELERADETLSCDEKGNCNPVVGQSEQAVSREIRTLGSHEVLVLRTQENETSHLRYFTLLKHGEQTAPDDVNRLYVFHFTLPTAEVEAGQHVALIETAETIVASLQPEW